MIFYVLPSLAFSGMLQDSKGTKKHFTSFIREGSNFQEERLHPDWLLGWPKASPSPVRRRPANVAMMRRLLGLLPMTGLTIPGQGCKVSESGPMWVCRQNGTRGEGRA